MSKEVDNPLAKKKRKVRRKTEEERDEAARARSVLEFTRSQRCTACMAIGPSDPDHVRSVGSGGKDVASNVWPLCRRHHVERHAKGLKYMIEKYPRCKAWLELMGRQDVLERVYR